MQQVLNRMNQRQEVLLVIIGDKITVGMTDNDLAAVEPAINSNQDKTIKER